MDRGMDVTAEDTGEKEVEWYPVTVKDRARDVNKETILFRTTIDVVRVYDKTKEEISCRDLIKEAP
jgi:hypothetical protein